MIINTVDVKGSTVWIDRSADSTADMEGNIWSRHDQTFILAILNDLLAILFDLYNRTTFVIS